MCHDGLDFHGDNGGHGAALGELGKGFLHVIHCGERSRELLSGLGLDQIFDIQVDRVRGPAMRGAAQQTGDPAENLDNL